MVPDKDGLSHIEMYNITIYGDLVFENPTDIYIKTESLNIYGGTLTIGSATAPYKGKAVI